MCEFEKKVLNGLIKCGVEPEKTGSDRIGVAVSGGADSISLLVSLSSIFSSLYVITVNHNIRPAAESRGDVDFVLEVCGELRRLGRQIECDVVELERGEVERTAAERGGGIEEAARFLRYAAFERFVAERGLSVLCLAHNKNDQLETVLMRFLQGSSAEGAGGIRARRECFVRPLLGIERQEIEEYVASRGFTWRTDKTNYETDYLRNKIRLKLVPFLDENFSGWQTAVLNGAEKASSDAQFIQSFIDDFSITQLSDGSVELPLSAFIKVPEAIKYRILLEACNRAGESSRIPHQFLKDVILALDSTESFTKHFSTIDIIKEKEKLFVKKHKENNTDLVFSAIIDKIGTYSFPFGILNVFNYNNLEGKTFASVKIGEGTVIETVQLPFYIRNTSSGDCVAAADGSEKKVSDIFSDWHVKTEHRPLVPVIQILNEKSQRIIAVLAGFLGYKDWIVKL